ncbi:4Fe-4S binding protein [Geosporobacter ferrireducens]|uniref:(4Fe-4S)-binding protein n=1 Tax=Geosporobacter ferrireducens TaxID=1424294 RepID=A0A1D8GHS0_9FIRM|nr:4Fe-4S binding protein [Geosporobacter ferrireducens]AOT70451.1 (4Fe-4S)-binding protein [Geosporobacter ferrireducens]MTI57204.1 4Fe-4S dicluster domain-containing protein [Geosporobacter ferrireducens]
MTKEEVARLKAEGFIAQKQKGYFSVRILSKAGNFTAEELISIGEISKKYGRGYVGMTVRLSAEIPWIAYENISQVKEAIIKSGLSYGGTGKRVRPILSCKGTVCTHGVIDTQEYCRVLHEKHFARPTPAKFKIGIVGCPNNCAKASLNDIGFMGQREVFFNESMCKQCGVCLSVCKVKALAKIDGKIHFNPVECKSCGACTRVCPVEAITTKKEGVAVFIGGKFGRDYRVGNKMEKVISTEEMDQMVDRIIIYYQKNAISGERLSDMIERITWEKVENDLMK